MASGREGGRRGSYQRISSSLAGDNDDLDPVPEDEEVIRPAIPNPRAPIDRRSSNAVQNEGVVRALLEHRHCLYGYSVLLLAFSIVALFYTVQHGGSGDSGVESVINENNNAEHNAQAAADSAPLLRIEGYDFIVVGAGPAGSIMARKLSDDPSKTVLLLEAGGPTQNKLGGKEYTVGPLTMFDIPLYWSTVAHQTEYHWDVKDAMIAKGLGGCGIHNAMLYVRAMEKDFDAWNMTDEGWTWASALSYYKKLENWEGPPSSYHGKGGPITTSPPLYIDQIAPYFLEACRVNGLPISDDFNNPNGRMGASYYHFNIKNGVRQSAAVALLAPVLQPRENLDVMLYAEVSKVLFKGAHDGLVTAVGVEFVDKDGEIQEARLKSPGEGKGKGSVVLTAGAIQTPKILMNSGIGDKKKLEKAGIPVLRDLPGVGANLQDHPAIPVTFGLSSDMSNRIANSFEGGSFEELTNYKNWVLSGGGILTAGDGGAGGQHGTTSAGSMGIPLKNDFPARAQRPYLLFASTSFTAGAFLKSDKGSKNPLLQGSYPDIQLTVFPRLSEPHLVAQKDKPDSNGTSPSSISDAEADSPTQSMLITIALLDPEARYTIELNETDPMKGAVSLKEVKLDENGEFLSDLDVAKLAWAVREVRVLGRTFPLTQVIQGERLPGADIIDETKLQDWINKNRYINSHWCGSAKMGKADDPLAVVDGRLKVIGVEGLRVTDASIFPTVPSGNTHSTVLVVSSKGADMIIQDYW